jgi:hypothetical protein
MSKCDQSQVNNDPCFFGLWLKLILRLADLFGVSVHLKQNCESVLCTKSGGVGFH